MVGRPYETVYKLTSLARWQRDWINKHRKDINYSGLVQDMLCHVIEKNDPEYYSKNKKHLDNRQSRRKDQVKHLMTF